MCLLSDDELAETVKTLQRALDKLGAFTESRERHERFLKENLDMCRRRSGPEANEVADWAITGLEVQHLEVVSSTYYSVVWRGRWREQVVAIKELRTVVDKHVESSHLMSP